MKELRALKKIHGLVKMQNASATRYQCRLNFSQSRKRIGGRFTPKESSAVKLTGPNFYNSISGEKLAKGVPINEFTKGKRGRPPSQPDTLDFFANPKKLSIKDYKSDIEELDSAAYLKLFAVSGAQNLDLRRCITYTHQSSENIRKLPMHNPRSYADSQQNMHDYGSGSLPKSEGFQFLLSHNPDISPKSPSEAQAAIFRPNYFINKKNLDDGALSFEANDELFVHPKNTHELQSNFEHLSSQATIDSPQMPNSNARNRYRLFNFITDSSQSMEANIWCLFE